MQIPVDEAVKVPVDTSYDAWSLTVITLSYRTCCPVITEVDFVNPTENASKPSTYSAEIQLVASNYILTLNIRVVYKLQLETGYTISKISLSDNKKPYIEGQTMANKKDKKTNKHL